MENKNKPAPPLLPQHPDSVSPALSSDLQVNRFQHIAFWLLVYLLLFQFGFVYFYRPSNSIRYPGLEYKTWVAILSMTGLVLVLFLPELLGIGVKLLVRLYRPVRKQLRPLEPVLVWVARRWDDVLVLMKANPYIRPAIGLFIGLMVLVAIDVHDLIDAVGLAFAMLAFLTHRRALDVRLLFVLAILLLLASSIANAGADRFRGEMTAIFLFYSIVAILLVESAQQLSEWMNPRANGG